MEPFRFWEGIGVNTANHTDNSKGGRWIPVYVTISYIVPKIILNL
jgi:hypothetical protein